MKILQINQNFNFGSTGKIMKEINDVSETNGNVGYMLAAYAMGASPNLYRTEFLTNKIASRKNILFHRITGLSGYGKRLTTKSALKWIDKIQPDIIHIHNIHGDWINVKMLMTYLKSLHKPVVWTLHDCWSFTGRCSHFENLNCYQWHDGCEKCPNMTVYPRSYFFDFSYKMWRDKKEWFSGFDKMTIVTPSYWLSSYVKQSYLKSYHVQVIHNGIDLDCFNRRKTTSKYLKEIGNRKVILGVASTWTPFKGLEDFCRLYEMISRHEYVIVLVGLNSSQIRSLPSGMIGIGRTNNVEELVELYSNAFVFVNPTYQDNYPTVNLEAIACGTPVITYNTGGSVESVPSKVGLIVEKGDVSGIKSAIDEICSDNRFSSQSCREYALNNFDKHQKYKEYMSLYTSLYGC